ncbi:MAG TPA: hypothetical protein VNI20_08150 [Fimbriimonadaceae bacterium]|nr:hypothetical protein [Fimbriimonadaceae bacterium]
MAEQKAEFWIVRVVTAIAVVVVIAVFFYPVCEQSREIHDGPSTLSNIKQQALACAMYMTDYDDRLQPAATWMDALVPYVKNDLVFRDVSMEDRKEDEYGCAFFSPLSLVDTTKVMHLETVPLTFQSSDLSRNANGRLDLLPGRLKDGMNDVSFLDYHAKAMPKDWPHGPITILLKEPDQ